MKILAIDDHELFRTGLRHLLFGIDSNVEFSGVDSVEVAVSVDQTECPELILLDYFMPRTHGKEALQRIGKRFPHSLIVVLSSLDEPRLIRDAIDQGAAGFIPKSSSQSVLINALKLILDGGIYLPRHMYNCADTTEFHQGIPYSRENSDLDLLNRLTERQREVVRWVVRGKSNKVIAYEMGISEGTVKSHLSTAYKALGVSSRTQAVLLCAKLDVEDNRVTELGA